MKVWGPRLLIVLLLLAVSACTTNFRDKFVGEWKSVNTGSEVHTFIKRSGDNFFITEGKQDLVGTYDETTKSMLIDNGSQKVPVLYMPDTDEIMISAVGKSAKFSRVK